MKKIFLIAAAAAMLFAACGNNNTKTNEPQAQNEPVVEEPVVEEPAAPETTNWDHYDWHLNLPSEGWKVSNAYSEMGIEYLEDWSDFNIKDWTEEDYDQLTFNVVEKMPEFEGGVENMMKFLQTNIKYPEEAKKKGTQGRVVVQFVVEKDGSIVESKVVKSVSPELDAEALRVVKAMPKWIPGEQRGKKVRVLFTLPVSFKIPEK